MNVRRYLRFSLRTLCLWMIAISVVLGIYVERAKRQRTAAHAATAQGGVVYYDRDLSPSGEVPMILMVGAGGCGFPAWASPRPMSWDQRLLGLDLHSRVAIIDLSSAEPDACGKLDWHSLRNVTALHLEHTELTAGGLKTLHPLTALRKLSLQGTSLTDADLANLPPLNQLEELYLNNTDVGDKGIKSLTKLRGLRMLHIGNTQVSRQSIATLREFRHLCELSVFSTPLADSSMAELKLALPNCEIYD